jgi:beta-phosphoglucomutase
MKKIAVLFDMDGVIIDSNPAHKKAILRFCEKYNKQLSDEEMKRFIWGRTNKEWIRHLFGEHITDEQLKIYADEKELLFRTIYEKDIKPLAGLFDFLNILEENNIPKAIGTSAPLANVDYVFNHIDIQKYFNAVLDEKDVTIGKPNPEIYLKAAKALNTNASDCIVIEDSLAGVEAGKRAGCKVIGITTTHPKHELTGADLAVADFSGLTLNDLKNLFTPVQHGA